MSNSEVLSARANLGNASRHGTTEEVADARRNLSTANIAACIEKNLAAAPPLTEDQLDRLAGMLRPFIGGAAK